MPDLTPCPTCSRHSLRGETCCPYCGNCVKTGRTAAAALVGLALAASGCEQEVMDTEPAYGAAWVDTGDTGDTGEE